MPRFLCSECRHVITIDRNEVNRKVKCGKCGKVQKYFDDDVSAADVDDEPEPKRRRRPADGESGGFLWQRIVCGVVWFVCLLNAVGTYLAFDYGFNYKADGAVQQCAFAAKALFQVVSVYVIARCVQAYLLPPSKSVIHTS